MVIVEMGKKKNHEQKIKLALCRRDYYLMAAHHPDLLEDVEAAVSDGVTPTNVRVWASGIVNEREIIQRCVNAASYAEWLGRE